MNKEVIKEKINWYKLLFTVLVTVTVSSIGWLTSHLDTSWKALIILDT